MASKCIGMLNIDEDRPGGGYEAPEITGVSPNAEIARVVEGVPEQARALKLIADTIGVKQEQISTFWKHITNFVA